VALSFPHQLKYFLDSYKVIDKYTRCPLHSSRSKLESLQLGCVWKYITGANLNGMHDSLIDCQAQTDIVTSDQLLPYLNVTNSIRLIKDIFTKMEQHEMAKGLELTCPVS
jgi:hypothetical protein